MIENSSLLGLWAKRDSVRKCPVEDFCSCCRSGVVKAAWCGFVEGWWRCGRVDSSRVDAAVVFAETIRSSDGFCRKRSIVCVRRCELECLTVGGDDEGASGSDRRDCLAFL